MKTLTGPLVALIWGLVPLRAVNIAGGEYYFDTDPGPGNGTAFPTEAAPDVSQAITVPATAIAALGDGFHTLVCRVRDADGDWSVAHSYPFYKNEQAATEMVPALVAGEYYFDTDPGAGNGIPFAFASSTEISTAVNVPEKTIAALDDGFHTLVCRVRDAQGDWSVAQSYPFHKQDFSGSSTPVISKIEYQWYQNKVPVGPLHTLTPDPEEETVSFAQYASLEGLQEGQSYQLVFTPYDDLGFAGVPQAQTVLVQTSDSDGDGIPDQWELTYGFDPNDPSDMKGGVDSDSDGVDNRTEFSLGINPLLTDSDGDGLSDKAEILLNALGFDPAVPNPALVAALQDNAGSAGFFTQEQLQALALGKPMLERDPVTGQFTLSLGLMKSTDLKSFGPMPVDSDGVEINPDGKIEYHFDSDSNAEFYRIEAE